MSGITQLLQAVNTGDLAAAGALMEAVYAELRGIARGALSRENADHILQPTALVHEAWLKLVDRDGALPFENRKHFFAAAGKAMRRILVDHARRQYAEKRRGNRMHVDLDQIQTQSSDREDLLWLDEALERLLEVDPQAGTLVDLRFFAGLTRDESATLLGISPRRADQLWIWAKAWLLRHFNENQNSVREPANLNA